MYKALSYFTDLQDNNYEYHAGDVYPRNGYEPSQERLDALSTKNNVRGVPVIAEFNDDKPDKAVEREGVDETPENFMNPPVNGEYEDAEPTPKKRGRKKKDA